MKWLLLLLPMQMGCSLIAGPIFDDANKKMDAGFDDAGSVLPDAMPAGDASAGTEDCLDGKDNDNDGKADCADPKCQMVGFACVPSATASWVHAAVAPMLACGGGTLPASLQLDPQHSDPCNCTCGAPTCTGAVVQAIGNDNQCGLGNTNHPGTGCSSPGVTTGGLNDYFKITPPMPMGGTCGGGLVDPTIKTTSTTACMSTKTGAGCNASEVCAWTGNAPACVAAAGIVGCPAGYPTSHLAIGGSNDARTCCTGCTYSCGGTLDCFDDSACTMNKIALTADDKCASHSGGSNVMHPYCKYAPAAACAPGSSTVSGSVTYFGQSTLCCL